MQVKQMERMNELKRLLPDVNGVNYNTAPSKRPRHLEGEPISVEDLQHKAEVDQFLQSRNINPRVADALRESHPAIQKHAMAGFPMVSTNPSGILHSRIAAATDHYNNLNNFIISNDIEVSTAKTLLECDMGIQKGVLRLPFIHAGTLEGYIQEAKTLAQTVQDFIKENDLQEKAAKMVLDADPAVQREVIRSNLKDMKSPSAAVISRVLDAERRLVR
eukprot:gnl/MRDRNA2_/MRDRNA2_72931_c0_seq1.p1 gnl/MRDRNA2_/MRDRNA2_72931_c0~~gnl/MRDRNA2_/MRDRNA2_72931_c0_seq1.p1  ORF type:complete len:218 (+),score=33.48 gnl/MRDRNA2_/MRDRNA2_72931_c0_seq1:431-1084(+)